MTRTRGTRVHAASRPGREKGVVVSVEECRRVEGHSRSGKALVKLLQDSPLRDVTIERTRTRGRVRGVEL